MLIKLVHCIQIDSRRRNRAQRDEDENGESVPNNPFSAQRSDRGAKCFVTVTFIGSRSSADHRRTQACSPPLLLLLL